ncbi:MAG: glycosyltransferase family 2 protein [Chloroflexi bacterium]|nr:glycosyltransferase family 2 protein [Chloroflexota bacterium]
MVDLSIIIVSWNTRALLADCLASVEATAGDLALDVWVVDNASHDGSVAMLRAHFPQVNFVENRANIGFAAANNQAIPLTTSPFVLLLNSDTVVQPGALAEIVAFMRATPRAGIVGANIVNADGSPQRCFGKFPTLLSESIYAWGLDARFPVDRHAALNGRAVATDWVLGAALTARRDALDQAGALDPAYFMYSEEVDLCYRVKRAGWDNYALPTARVVHLGGESTKQVAAPMKAELFRSKVRYFRKHHGALAARALDLIFSASILSRRIVARARGRAEASTLWADAWTHYSGKGAR